MSAISFFVPGIPRPGGSKRGFVIPGTKRVVITEDCKRSKDWRTSVAWAAKEAIQEPLRGALRMEFTFILPRPKGHFGKGGVRKSAPVWPAVRPDTTKLIRSTEDALKGIAYLDDSQIVQQMASKCYQAGPDRGAPGCVITIWALDDQNVSNHSQQEQSCQPSLYQ